MSSPLVCRATVTRVRVVAAATLSLTLLASCSKDGGTGVDDLLCVPVLGSQTVTPFGTVSVSGVPAAMPDSLLSVVLQTPSSSASGGIAATVATVARNPDGTLSIGLPPHPTTPMQGGSADLVVSAGTTICSAVAVTVQALPAAPGTAAQVQAASQSMLASLATLMGTTSAALQAPTSSLPPELLALGMAQRFFDHPDNPNSVKALLAGTAPALGGQKVDLALLDAVLAKSGVLASIQKLTDSLVALPPLESAVFETDPSGAAGSNAAGGGESVSAGPSRITSPIDLTNLMRLQQRAAQAAGPQASAVMAQLTNVLTVLSFIPAAGPATTVVGIMAYAYGLLVSGLESLLPSELVSLTAVVTPTTFNEDATASGHWASVQLTARGEKFELTVPTIVDGLLTAFGASGKVIKQVFTRLPGLKTAFETSVSALVSTIAGSLNAVTGAAAGEYEISLGVFKAGPYTYGPVDVTAPVWTTVTVTTPNVIELQTNLFAFKPMAPGTTDLIIRTNPKYFGQKVIEKRTAISVARMTIELTPVSSTMRPGTQASFNAVVRNADAPQLTLSANGGTISQSGNYTAPLTQGTYTITAVSVSRPTLRATATVEVRDVVTVSVSPAFTEVAKGGTRAFTATVEGTQNLAVTWSVPIGSGSITSTGVFTAPQTAGTVIVTARSVADPTRTGTAQVQVTEPAKVRPSATIAAGYQGTCALDYLGAAWCWGVGTVGQLGNGQSSSSYVSGTPVPVSGGRTYVALSGNSSSHFCALDAVGAAYCWGGGTQGALGNGSETNSNVPVAVAGGLNFKSLSVGMNITCGVTSQDQSYCWGNGQNGVFGAPAPSSCRLGYICTTPQLASGLGGLSLTSISLAAVTGGNCGITTGTQVYCWGTGYLGDGVNHTSPSGPVLVTGAAGIAYVGTSQYASCTLSTVGSVSCWGQSGSGNFGNGVEKPLALTPVPGANGMTFTSLSVGWTHACGLTAAGRAYCWGNNNQGAVGIPYAGTCGPAACVLVPTEVFGARTYAAISAGANHSCGITTDGEAYCWGSPSSLGLANNGSSYFTPVKVGGGVRFMVPSP